MQEASYSDIEELATLLQHVDVVVCNAGTILLDALVGDRPAVCVLYDEGAPPGESWAAKNVVGEHYQELAASGAFHRAERFEEVVAGIERALAQPEELAEARRRAVEPASSGSSTDGRPSGSSRRSSRRFRSPQPDATHCAGGAWWRVSVAGWTTGHGSASGVSKSVGYRSGSDVAKSTFCRYHDSTRSSSQNRQRSAPEHRNPWLSKRSTQYAGHCSLT